MINQLIKVVKLVNQEILNIYDSDDYSIEIKDDMSPVTRADIASHEILIKELKKILDIPVMSEESIPLYEQRRYWDKFWMIDPLDGTKDFIKKNGGFTVNIALLEKNIPILGVVSIPVSGDIYYAIKDSGAYKNGERIYNNSIRKELIGADSNFHSTDLIQEFFKKYHIKDIRKIGSSIKLCKLAEGIIDVYPRLNGTKEWDTAAAHIIANEAGCKLIDVETKKELTYNKEDYRNNYFIASRNDLEFEI